MSVNKFVIRQDGFQDKQINIPVSLTWDYLGLDMAIEEYEKTMITEVIGVGRDFEVSRFAHLPATATTNNTEINYEFYFYSGGSLSDINNWKINYLGEGFTPQELYYYENNFSNSFFKLDFYDNTDDKKQESNPFSEQLSELTPIVLGAQPVTHYDTEAEAIKHSSEVANILNQIDNKAQETDPYAEQVVEMETQALQAIDFEAINKLTRTMEHQKFLCNCLRQLNHFLHFHSENSLRMGFVICQGLFCKNT